MLNRLLFSGGSNGIEDHFIFFMASFSDVSLKSSWIGCPKYYLPSNVSVK